MFLIFLNFLPIFFPASSSKCTADYVCPGAGYFPKYDDCLQYYYCAFDATAKKYVATQKTCNTGYSFNPTGPQDRMCLKGSACVTATCTVNKAAEWKAMNYVGFTSNQIALYCVNAKPGEMMPKMAFLVRFSEPFFIFCSSCRLVPRRPLD
jgi:hypothetical protein